MTRHTQIICTIGPASRALEVLQALLEAGMDVARLNFSHGQGRDHIETARQLRATAQRIGRPVKILQDLQGPKLRIGDLGHPIHFRSGDKVALVRNATQESDLPVADPEILTWMQPGDRVFLDDGAVELEVLESRPERVGCVIAIGGRVDSHSGIQLPARTNTRPTLSQKDREDARLGVAFGVEWIAQSMVHSGADVAALNAELGHAVPVIAKIETAAALAALDPIADAAWGLMVARGDLGVSIPRAQVPLWQKQILTLCRDRGRFGIVATEMLLSMVKNERPTRAEVSDVATAVLDGADGVMLSEETAIGRHPVQAVVEMRQIIETVEASRWYHPPAA